MNKMGQNTQAFYSEGTADRSPPLRGFANRFYIDIKQKALLLYIDFILISNRMTNTNPSRQQTLDIILLSYFLSYFRHY